MKSNEFRVQEWCVRTICMKMRDSLPLFFEWKFFATKTKREKQHKQTKQMFLLRSVVPGTYFAPKKKKKQKTEKRTKDQVGSWMGWKHDSLLLFSVVTVIEFQRDWKIYLRIDYVCRGRGRCLQEEWPSIFSVLDLFWPKLSYEIAQVNFHEGGPVKNCQ